MADIVVSKNTDQLRWEAHDGDELVGFSEYIETDDVIVLPHTVVHREGEGIGGKIVRVALDAIRAEGTRKVMPQCPFVKAWIGKHPEYADLVYGAAPRA